MNTNNVVERVDVIKQSLVRRRSVRTFKKDPIPPEVLDELIEVAKYAPSGSYWQNQRCLVVRDPGEINKIGHSRLYWPIKAKFEK